MGRTRSNMATIGLVIRGGLFMVVIILIILFFVFVFIALCSANAADKKIQESTETGEDLKNRIDAIEMKFQTLLEKLEEDGK